MIIGLLFVLGVVLGSFYLVVGTRLPRGENITTSRSKCDVCGAKLKWYELIPLFSFIIQGGKCRHCHKMISIDHFLVELSTGMLFVLGYLYLGLNIHFYTYLVITSVALIIFISDFKYMIILDSPIVIGSILVLILRYIESGLEGLYFALVYGFLLFIIMNLIKALGDKIFKRESLGGGDIKLGFLIGLTLGYEGIGLRMGLIAIIFASFLALPYAIAVVYLNKKNELPYGPFLIAALVIIYVFIEKFSNLLIFFSL